MHRLEKEMDFTLDAVAGDYAPEVYYLNVDSNVRTGMDLVRTLTQHVEQLPAGAVIEVDILKAGGNAGTTADWLTAVVSINAVGFQAPRDLGAWRGVRVRAKSGGTAGTAKVHTVWSSQSA